MSEYKDRFPGLENKLLDLNRDPWAVLTAKAKDKSEADEKMRGVVQGEGMWAYVRIHKWFSQTTEQGMLNRRTNIMNPEPVKHDWEVAGAIERWEERCRTLREEEQEEELPERYKMAAIRRMLTGDIKRHVDLEISKISNYEQLRRTIMNWAVDRKPEKDRKDDPMDRNDVSPGEDNYHPYAKTTTGNQHTGAQAATGEEAWGLNWQWNDNWDDQWEWDCNMISKGKGKGKGWWTPNQGKGGKSKGKGTGK